MIRSSDDSYIMKCFYGRTLKSMFESIGKITLDRMVCFNHHHYQLIFCFKTFFIVFRENEIRLSVKDSSGLFNSIVVKKGFFEESHIKKSNANDGGYLAILDIKDFNTIQKV